MGFFQPQNPGIDGLDELTSAEEILLTSLAGLSYQDGDVLYYNGGAFQRLPIGTSGQVLKVTATEDAVEWGTGGGGGGTPGGSNTEVQFNDSGSFGGDPTFTFNKTTNLLSVDHVTSSTDVEVSTIASGFILKSPDGTRWRFTITNAGELVATSL